MAKYERLTVLLELLGRRGRLSVEEAAAELHVSPATIRRDFDHLAGQQLLTRAHGGAVANATAYELPLRYKSARKADEKLRIAARTAAMVPLGATVGLTGGTTTTEVARALAQRPDLSDRGHDPALTVVTNAVNIAGEMTVRAHIKTVVTGGVARPQSFELVGPLALESLAELHLDFGVIGVDGLDIHQGATTAHEGEARVNRLLVDHASRVVVVADASKLGHPSFVRICPIERIDVLVTDAGADEDLVAELADHGVEVVLA
ncbi:MAG TPA: DeoR/GlpR family DNA-binding transcription regulator [Segeticoccus sp.]|uniref:DeoR/GlpR family DNA-binding transcription regulator n=1 Tax=Segeticoccus sp. TaxID=2706531 RepID=UPI002D80F46E|nr:DeoR/GlpR family DNA-binding transcription regulator [Segeticoccus sp.]HET8598709.1 DeoR/GlpR family DNA-binding transcription regulator [Segeticoccus sp.]